MSIYYCKECKDEAYVRFLRSGVIQNTEDKFVLAEDEAKVLWEIIKDQYISYEHLEQHALLRRLMVFIQEREKVDAARLPRNGS